MDGQLNVFDPETETYTPAGAKATVVVNAIGFNQQDDLIYGITVRDGVDALGQAVSKADLVMYDAEGHAYRVGETPYRSWTGDFDDKGNLWVFEADFDRVTMVDVDQRDADGNPLATTFRFPTEMIGDKVWDVAFDAASQSFYGLVKPKAEGGDAKLFQIDVSTVEGGGEPTFSTRPVTGTVIDGVLTDGVPSITFGAFVIDGDGNFYAGGNGGDHDLIDATGTSGGIVQVEINDDGTARLTLVSDAPKAYSNDGAVDPRAMDPFTQFDPSAMVPIRGPELYEVEDVAQSYDDVVNAGAGNDEVHGGYGVDLLVGASRGDTINGDDAADALYGGAVPDKNTAIVSVYDDDGLRFDQFGNLLPEDDDALFGGEGDDLLDGSAGHDPLFGGAGDDTLDGGSGDDRLDGGDGDDSLFGGEGADHLKGGSGADQLLGGDGKDYLNGGSGDDRLDGGDGADRIYMGAGEDIASGGAGSDWFVFRAEDLDGSADTISDFVCKGPDMDLLDLRALDLLTDGDCDAWIADNVQQDTEGGLLVDLGGGSVYLQAYGVDLLDGFSDSLML